MGEAFSASKPPLVSLRNTSLSLFFTVLPCTSMYKPVARLDLDHSFFEVRSEVGG